MKSKKRIVFIVFIFFLFLSGCENRATENDVINKSYVILNYVEGFSDTYNNFKINEIEFLEFNDKYYYLVTYEGVHTISIPILDIYEGNHLISSSLCVINPESNDFDCINGRDVDGTLELATTFQDIYSSKEKHNYMRFTDGDLDRFVLE